MKYLKPIRIALWVMAGIATLALLGQTYLKDVPERVQIGEPISVDVDTPSGLPKHFEFSDFEFVDHRGETFASDRLDGKPWIGFIFLTHCPTGACPVMIGKMADLQMAIPDERVEFVSFSVDPERDTPDAMSTYVERMTGKTPGDRWHLLVGETRDEMVAFAEENNLSVGDDFGHSTYFLLVDGDGWVRGLYGNNDPTAMAQVAADVAKLLETEG